MTMVKEDDALKVIHKKRSKIERNKGIVINPNEENKKSTLNTSTDLFYKILNYKEPTVVFIDGANFTTCCEKINVDFDYKQFNSFIMDRTHLISIKYYTAVPSEGEESAFIRWLRANGYNVYCKLYQQDNKKNIDAELSCDISIVPHIQPSVRHIILLSADSDYCHAIEHVKKYGVKVSCISPIRSHNMTSRKLIETVDYFVDLERFVEDNELIRKKKK